MGFEIDYMPVGDGEKSGDAITLRFGNLFGPRSEQRVIVIDGGFQDSGEELANHIKEHYKTDQIDLVISTHPDADHVSGLSVILENFKVNAILMHKPWEHTEDIKNLFKDGRITASGLETRLEKSLQQASDLESLAREKGVHVYEPFEGDTAFNGIMHILGPSQDYYESLLPLFRGTPQPISSLASIFEPIKKAAQEVIEWVSDHMGIDLLDDEDRATAENNTSTVILFTIDGKKLLFTGDAGITALTNAVDYAESKNIKLDDLNFFDMPHHGSKRNIGSSILKRIKTGLALASASMNSKKHPAKKVTNALQKHGATVYSTKGAKLRHHHDAPDRVGWSTAQPIPFYDKVEK
jgi:beta-lactamase superfamily II metal-dependent hydrolase